MVRGRMRGRVKKPAVAPSLVVLRDDFIGASGTALESHVTNIGSKAWVSSVAGAYQLNGSGLVVDTSAGGANFSLVDAGISDFSLDWAATGSSAADSSNVSIPDIYFRYVDANNYCKVFIDTRPASPPSVLVIQVVGGTNTTQLTFTSNPPASGVQATGNIRVQGSALTLTFNGGTATTTIPSTTGTKVGLHAEGTFTPASTWDFIQVSRLS